MLIITFMNGKEIKYQQDEIIRVYYDSHDRYFNLTVKSPNGGMIKHLINHGTIATISFEIPPGVEKENTPYKNL